MNEYKIEIIPIEKINASEYNPRAISEEAFLGLRSSIREFGMPQPLVVNIRPDGSEILAGGHQRLKAAIEEGWTHVPVRFVRFNEIKEKALNVVLNNKHIEGHFTPDLQVVLNEIEIELGNEFFTNLKLDRLKENEEWISDINAVEKTKENLDGIPGKIIITCKQDDKDAVLFYLKDKLMETSFEGIHIE